MKKPDVKTLPSSGGKTVDKTGVHGEGYLDKKGTPSGESAMFNSLPPGTNIEDQKLADIRPQEFKTIVGLGFPGDGWSE